MGETKLLNLWEQPALLEEISVRAGVSLRPLAVADADGVLRVLDADPSIRETVTVAARLHSAADVVKEIESCRTNGWMIRYVVVYEGQIAGLVSLWRDTGFFGQPVIPQGYGFGYFIDPAMRGKGLVTACVDKLMDVAQDSFLVNAFIAFCEDGNAASVAVLKRLGFKPTDQTYPEPDHGWMERMYIKRKM